MDVCRDNVPRLAGIKPGHLFAGAEEDPLLRPVAGVEVQHCPADIHRAHPDEARAARFPGASEMLCLAWYARKASLHEGFDADRLEICQGHPPTPV